MSDVVQPLRPADIQDLSPADLAQRLSQFESMRLAQMADSRDQLWEEMQVHGRNSGVPMPWDDMHGKWGWREGEVTLIAGPNNSAKSALMSQMALHYSRYHPVGMMSLEEPFRAQVYRFQKQAFATDEVSRKSLTSFAISPKTASGTIRFTAQCNRLGRMAVLMPSTSGAVSW